VGRGNLLFLLLLRHIGGGRRREVEYAPLPPKKEQDFPTFSSNSIRLRREKKKGKGKGMKLTGNGLRAYLTCDFANKKEGKGKAGQYLST